MTDTFQPVLSIRESVDEPDAPSFIREALREIRAYIEEEHVEVDGPPFSIRHPAPHHRVDVEVGWPVRSAVGAGRIISHEMPPGLIRRSEGEATRSPDAVA